MSVVQLNYIGFFYKKAKRQWGGGQCNLCTAEHCVTPVTLITDYCSKPTLHNAAIILIIYFDGQFHINLSLTNAKKVFRPASLSVFTICETQNWKGIQSRDQFNPHGQ